MDGIDMKKNFADFLKKYRYVAMIFLVGLFLMMIPEASEIPEDNVVPVSIPEYSLETALEQILSNIDGAGSTKVLLTEAKGARTFYQIDEDSSTNEKSSSQRKETVIISDSGREENGLIVQTNPPIYQGAVVLCQGADKPQVKLSVVEAVSNATGLSTDKITVLKMK